MTCFYNVYQLVGTVEHLLRMILIVEKSTFLPFIGSQYIIHKWHEPDWVPSKYKYAVFSEKWKIRTMKFVFILKKWYLATSLLSTPPPVFEHWSL